MSLVPVLVAWGLFVSGRGGRADEQPPRCLEIAVYYHGNEGLERAAAEAAARFATERTGVAIRRHDLDAGDGALERLANLAERLRFDPLATPVLVGCNRVVRDVRDPAAIVAILRELCEITLYMRTGCSRCAAAKAWLPTLLERCPGFTLKSVDIGGDTGGRARLEQLVKQHQGGGASVPVIHLCNSVVVGFDAAETTGKKITTFVDRWTVECVARESAAGALSTGTGTAPRSAVAEQPAPAADDEPAVVEAPLLKLFDGRLDPRRLGMPLFTLAVGLVDGFNPCAMWVLLLLLSILVNLRDRWRILAIAGTFVVVSGAAYMAFMAAWLNVFEWVGYLRPVQVALGLMAIAIGSIHVKDFVAFRQGVSLSIPEAAKPGIYARMRRIVTAENLPAAIAGAFTLAVLVNVVELLCTAGLPAVYTSVLAQQGFSALGRYAYLLLYIVAYMFDDAVMVAGVTWSLSRFKLQEAGGRWLKLVSGGVILLLGLVMLFRPEWLA
jgi:glutaredoxin